MFLAVALVSGLPAPSPMELEGAEDQEALLTAAADPGAGEQEMSVAKFEAIACGAESENCYSKLDEDTPHRWGGPGDVSKKAMKKTGMVSKKALKMASNAASGLKRLMFSH